MALPADFAAKLAATRGNPNEFSKLIFGTPLHGGQCRYAENAVHEVNFCLPGNSWGKTEFIARFATYLSWWKVCPNEPTTAEEWNSLNYKGLIASYNYPIAKESFDRLEVHRRNRPELEALISGVSKSDPPRITFTNGAILDWGSLDGQGKLVEAARRQFIMVDEAGHIPDISYTFDNILFPRTMGVGGRIHLLGTPKAHSDPYLLEIYEKGKDGKDPFYFSYSGSVLENEYWSDKERQRVLKNPRYVTGWVDCEQPGGCGEPICRDGQHPILTQIGKQVLLGHFIISGGYFFNRFYVQRMFTGDYDVQWHGENHFKVEPEDGHLYLAAFDLAGNRQRKRKKHGSDATVGFVIDYTARPWKIVRYDYVEGGSLDWQGKYELMSDVYHTYRMPYLLIDATGPTTDSVKEALEERGVQVEGVQFGGNSGKKFDMLRNLQLALELEWGGQRGLLRSPLIEQLKKELDHYVIPDDDVTQDTVMALAMVVHHAVQWEMPSGVGGEVY